MPLAIQLIGLWTLGSQFDPSNNGKVAFSWFYLTTMTVCSVFYCVLWCAYIYFGKTYDWENRAGWNYQAAALISSILMGLSYLALIFIALLLTAVIKMTHAIINGTPSAVEDGSRSLRLGDIWDRRNLKMGASEEPFGALVFFLTIFLGISYLFGLALAFHDKSRPPNDPALYMINLYRPAAEQTAQPLEALADEHISFQSGKALLKSGANEAELNKLTDAIKAEEKMGEVERGYGQVRAILIGRADAQETKGGAYQSNYELGEARAQNVKLELIHRLSSVGGGEWLNVDWVCLSESNEREGSKREAEVVLQRNSGDPVSVMIPHLNAQHPNPLSLMDYVYFANYTITTTGYGDIIPNTAYTKFICSFANICEVFFLVVFFNALLSIKGSEEVSALKLLSDRVGDLAHALGTDGSQRATDGRDRASGGKTRGPYSRTRDTAYPDPD